MLPVRGDVTAVPLADGCADVVVAGEILEHVTDLAGASREACRLLRPGGLLVIDTLAATALARLVAVRLAERLPGAPRRASTTRPCSWTATAPGPRVRPARRRPDACGASAPSVRDLLGWLRRRVDTVRMAPRADHRGPVPGGRPQGDRR